MLDEISRQIEGNSFTGALKINSVVFHILNVFLTSHAGHTICALGDAAAWPIQGLIRHFQPGKTYIYILYVLIIHSLVCVCGT